MKNKKDIKLNNTKYESAVPMRVCTKCIPSNAIIVAANKAYISFLKSSFAIRYIINIINIPAIFPPNLYANGVTPKKYIGIDIISFPNGGCVYS